MINLTKHDREIIQAMLDGKELEYSCDGGNIWYPVYNFSGYIKNVYEDNIFRVAAETILVNGIKVLAPLRVKPVIGERYYVACHEWYEYVTWQSDRYDDMYFSAGICHANVENAQKHWEAMIKPSKIV